MNTRIRTTTTGAPIERKATETHIFYDPQTKGANIVFQGEEFLLNPDGSAGDKLEGRQSLVTSLDAIAGRTFHAGADPVTGADLSQISPEGVGLVIRALYDALHQAEYAPKGD